MTIEFAKQDAEEYPRGKLAEATIKFENGEYGPLNGCALTGFGVWSPENTGDEPLITLPARVYSANGERRRFELLNPADPDRSVEPLKTAIRTAWRAIGEASGEIAVSTARPAQGSRKAVPS